MSSRIRFLLALLGATVLLFLNIGTGAFADSLSDLTQQLLKSEPLIPDGTVSILDPLPYGNSIHVVSKDNMDGWKIQTSSGATTFELDQCDPSETPLPTGALHLVVVPGVGPLTYARLRSTRYHRTYLRDLTRLDYYACGVKNNFRCSSRT